MANIRYVVLPYADKNKQHLRWVMDLHGEMEAEHDLHPQDAQIMRYELERNRKDGKD